MNVLVLGMASSPVSAIVAGEGHTVIERSEPFDVPFLETHGVDFIVSYRFRHIIRKPILDYLQGRAINLHISYLPWNRGADPNLWSFLENTPKGVTIHYIDEGIDTGDVIAQRLVACDADGETLATSYAKLNLAIVELFAKTWPLISSGNGSREKQVGQGTMHRMRDKERFTHLLTNGWQTPVSVLVGGALYGVVSRDAKPRSET